VLLLAARLLLAPKPVKEMSHLGPGEIARAVAHAQTCRAAAGVGGIHPHLYPSRVGSIFDGVLEKIDQYQPQ
jgi:hypothetical protein